MHLQQSRRALDVMRRSLAEQRRHPRIQLPIRATAVFPELSREPCTGLLRDMSMLGAFFYCKQRPEVRNKVTLELVSQEPSNKMKVTFDGIVVRIEEPARGAAIGVAVQFTGRGPVQTAAAEHNAHDGWSAQMS